MEEQLITYKTSRLAKEKGFDEYIQQFYLEESEDEEVWEDDETMDMYEDDEIFYAPTQSLLQKWLREEKYLDVIVTPDFDKNFYDWYIYNQDMGERQDCADQTYQSYEEALEEGLQEGLKLIK